MLQLVEWSKIDVIMLEASAETEAAEGLSPTPGGTLPNFTIFPQSDLSL
jgi:hypothetical protein